MFVELIDALRCPHPHPAGEPESWLVAVAQDTVGRCVVRGVLGCPVCYAEFPIENGVARFAPTSAPVSSASDPGESSEDAFRLAALLNLSTPGGIIAVAGAWDAAVDTLLGFAEVRVLVVDPVHAYRSRDPVGALTAAGLPVAAGALRGVALDARTATPERLAAAVRALAPRGRLVAPAAVPVPDGVRELARDASHWVAEREAEPSGIVPLRRHDARVPLSRAGPAAG